METKKKSLLYSTIYMFVLAAILTFLLALINNSTKAQVERNAVLKEKSGILYVFGIENDGSTDDVFSKIDKYIVDTGKTFNDSPVYSYEKDGKIEGYAFTITGSGLWGPIEGIMGVNPDFTQTLGIEFLEQSETPGLGGRISEIQYKEQYRNATVGEIRNDVDAISGATGTSNAVFRLVDDNLSRFIESQGGN